MDERLGDGRTDTGQHNLGTQETHSRNRVDEMLGSLCIDGGTPVMSSSATDEPVSATRLSNRSMSCSVRWLSSVPIKGTSTMA
jgi:hypothetical protein